MNIQLSKEEILSEVTGEEGIYLTHGMIRGSDALEAMLTFAKQECIAFENWRIKRSWDKLLKMEKESGIPETTEQLYELYLLSIKQG